MSKNHKTVGVVHLENALVEFKMNQTELGEAMGMSSSFISSCLKSRKAPAWTHLATECLRRRNGLHHDDTTLVVKVPGPKKVAVETFLDALGITSVSI